MGKDTYLESKPRYEILDGLRGVAALVVIMYHLFETYFPMLGKQVFHHGYLAVDFFFVLSGFVIGYAYDDRWGKMTTWGFFKRRLVRLHPLAVIGTLIGAALFFFQDAAFPMIREASAWKFFFCVLMGVLMIPVTPGMDIRGCWESNPLNGPNWTLTYEYFGNILYALIFRKLPKVALGVLCVLTAFLTLNMTLDLDVFGILPDGKFDVIGGWNFSGYQIFIAFSRLLYPFICGLLISRILPSRMSPSCPSGSPISLKGGFWWCALTLVVIFSVPLINGRNCLADGIYQSAAILILFPLLVLAGAGSEIKGVRSQRICRFLGEISYPLYITHYPLAHLQKAWVAGHADAALWMHVFVTLSVIVLAIAMAWAIYRMYDIPVRAWLTEHWLKKSGKVRS